MKKINGRILIASAASLLLVSALCVGSYAALQQSGAIPSDSALNQEEAKAIVLAHARIDSSDVWFEEVDIDHEKGVAVYEIEFYADGVEYEYKIDAKSGEILKAKVDAEDSKGNSSAPNAPGSDVQYIGKEKAKEIALAHAGVSAKDARFGEFEFDYDDGRAVYDLEFFADGVEYDYEINAISGEVLKSKREGGRPAVQESSQKSAESAPSVAPVEHEVPVRSDAPEAPAPEAPAPEAPAPEAPAPEAPAPEAPAPEAPAPEAPAPEAPAPEAPAYIGNEQAKALAFAHAKVDSASVRYVDVEFDIDDGRTVYELEFYLSGYEYEYEIDALSGKILEFDKEYDD